MYLHCALYRCRTLLSYYAHSFTYGFLFRLDDIIEFYYRFYLFLTFLYTADTFARRLGRQASRRQESTEDPIFTYGRQPRWTRFPNLAFVVTRVNYMRSVLYSRIRVFFRRLLFTCGFPSFRCIVIKQYIVHPIHASFIGSLSNNFYQFQIFSRYTRTVYICVCVICYKSSKYHSINVFHV